MFEVRRISISSAALTAAMIPLTGALGVITAGWISDKLFHYERGQIAAVMLFTLAAAVFAFLYMPTGSLA